jgi:hypothetical protein
MELLVGFLHNIKKLYRLSPLGLEKKLKNCCKEKVAENAVTKQFRRIFIE